MDTTENISLTKPWALELKDILSRLEADPKQGLDDKKVKERRQKYGFNRLRQRKKKSAWQILANQFQSLIIWILVAASAFSFIFTNWVDGLAIAVVVILNSLIGFFMELNAVRSMEALRKMEQITAKVVRGGKLKEIPAMQLVPGDIVTFEGGEIVSADMRVAESSKLRAEESMLTGEPEPVTKHSDVVDKDSPLAERGNMLFKGTSITRGSGKAVVTATGMETELGRISRMAHESSDEFTPLEKRLGKFGAKLLWVTFGVLVIVTTLGIFRGQEMLLMIETGIALAVAAVPEGLPIVATLAMARGMVRMAKRNALVNRLAAVETLGGTNVIFTDKTGTLTENKMTVTEIALKNGTVKITQHNSEQHGGFERQGNAVSLDDDGDLLLAVRIGVLCNNASLEHGTNGKAVGEPLEAALLIAGKKAQINRPDLLKEMPEVREEAFDPDVKMMATYHKLQDSFFVAVKGAPEPVLKVCSSIQENGNTGTLDEQQKRQWIEKNDQMAQKGLRMLALAYKVTASPDEEPYRELVFVGLVGMMDPPRAEVKDAIALCQRAGLKVVMVTGDQSETAAKVASDVGLQARDDGGIISSYQIKPPEELTEEEKQKLLQASVFARVSPEQKLDLVDIHRRAGSVVAMTGDGVNDAPGLRKADIGIAMGKRGTQVAQEASDMVLKDDSFNTIVAAIQQGRVIFNNIRQFIVYLLSGNAGEIMIVFIASLFGAPLPLLPLQILLLNIINDVFPSLALGLGEGSGDVMKGPPRDPEEPILKLKHWLTVFGYGVLVALPVLGGFLLSLEVLEYELDESISISFLTLGFARLWHIFNMRNPGSTLIKNEVVSNKYVWAAIGICTVLLLSAVYLPVISGILKLKAPTFEQWLIILSISIVPFIIGQLLKIIFTDQRIKAKKI